MRAKDLLLFSSPALQELENPNAIFVEDLADSSSRSSLLRSFRVRSLALGYPGLPLTSLGSRGKFEASPYDFDKIIQAVDTDSYLRQAMSKYKELFWKEGWEIVSENPRAIEYLRQRIDYMEVAMDRSFQDFLLDVSDQWFKFANVFFAKSRDTSGEFTSVFDGRIIRQEDYSPIIGYYVLPTEQMEIRRTVNNRPLRYRQNTSASILAAFSGNRSREPSWNSDDVVHLYLDRKPGRAFGTPFLVAALDDIVALRQIEEDIQNLIHRELFPLYKYRIGNEEFPATDEEIANAVSELEGLRTEGGLIMPGTHDVDVIGGQQTALDASSYLSHFKERVAVGLGLYPHHLGMSAEGGNRSVTDRLDTALYDKIKLYQMQFAEAMRVKVFNELLVEGGFNPYPDPRRDDVSDRCFMRFNEIDVDTQVKKETHTIQKMSMGAITIPEARQELKMPNEYEVETTLLYLQTALSAALNAQQQADAPATAPSNTTRTDQQKPSTGGSPNQKNLKKGASNIIRPLNQFGTRTSPDIRRSDSVDDSFLSELVELIDVEEDDTIVEE